MEPGDIQSLPLFAGLSPEEQRQVAAAARAVHYNPGEQIVHQGELSFDFYAITNGTAEVRRDNEHIADLGAGDVVGEMGVITRYSAVLNRRRGATVTVTAPTDAIAIDGRVFREFTEAIPALGDALRALVEERRGPPSGDAGDASSSASA